MMKYSINFATSFAAAAATVQNAPADVSRKCAETSSYIL